MFDKLIKKETLVVAFLTLLSYGTALIYELPSSKIFEFPFDLISIDVKILFSSGIRTLIFFTFLSTLVRFFYKSLLSFGAIGNYLVALFFKSGISLFMGLLAYIITNEMLAIYSSVFLILFLIIMYTPWKKIKNNNMETLLNESISKMFNENNIKKELSLGEKAGALGFTGLLYILFVQAIGTIDARNPREFYTFNLEKNNYAIIKIYGDNLVAVKLNSEKKRVGTFYFKTDIISNKEIFTEKLDLAKKNEPQSPSKRPPPAISAPQEAIQ